MPDSSDRAVLHGVAGFARIPLLLEGLGQPHASFIFWKDADPDLKLLQQARSECEKLSAARP
jgi:hypothetical protein